MPNHHPTIKTLEEFCKFYEQESEIGKRKLFEIHQIAQKHLDYRRARDKRRYWEKKEENKAKREEKKKEEFEERCISIQTEPEAEPEKPLTVVEESKPLETIQEEEVVVPVKVKRNSFTIPRPNIAELSLRSPSPSRAAYPQIISNTKTKREPKRAPEV